MRWTFTKILSDNYSWVVFNDKNEAIVMDCGDYDVVLKFLKDENLSLKYILLTHSHDDHKAGVKELKQVTQALVVGNKNFTERLPKLDIEVAGGDDITLLGEKIKVFATPGHCADHLSFFFEKDKYFFSGDFLFSLGCGRIFEGDPAIMIKSFSVFNNLPLDTLIFPSHEYTKSNLSFTKSLGFFDLGDRERFILENDITLPTTLEFEFSCNPFLNIYNEQFKYHVTQNENLDAVSFFTFLRETKNNKTKLIGG